MLFSWVLDSKGIPKKSESISKGVCDAWNCFRYQDNIHKYIHLLFTYRIEIQNCLRLKERNVVTNGAGISWPYLFIEYPKSPSSIRIPLEMSFCYQNNIWKHKNRPPITIVCNAEYSTLYTVSPYI
jgi:hypothetical protein